MSGLEAYRIFTSIKLHFNSKSYDYFKYRGQLKSIQENKVRATPNFIYFEKIARKHGKSMEEFIVSNFLNDPTISGPRSLSEDVYTKYKAFKESFTYRFKEEISRLDPKKDFRVIDGQHPGLLKEYLSGRINIQTMVALNQVMKYREVWDAKIQEEYIWPRISKHLEKSSGFLIRPTKEIIFSMKEVFDKREDI
jgi:hypothetical protein